MGLFRRAPPMDPGRADEIRAEKQRYLRAVRRGGYGRQAQREQRRLDRLNEQRRGKAE